MATELFPSWQRSLFYTTLGVTNEVVYTGIKNFPRLQGHTQLWVFPLYAVGGLVFEKIHDRLRDHPLYIRVAVYALTFFAFEYAGGWMATKMIGECPWVYESAWAVHGYINLAFFPLWGTLGLVAEKVHDYFLSLKKDERIKG